MKKMIISITIALSCMVSIQAVAEQQYAVTRSQIDAYCAKVNAEQGTEDLVTWQHFNAQAKLSTTYWHMLAEGMPLPAVVQEISDDTRWDFVAHDRLRTTGIYQAVYMYEYSDKFKDMSDEQMVEYWETEFSK